jgi:hypothetical protein
MSDGNSSSGGAPELLQARLREAGLVPDPEPQSLHANFSAPGQHIDQTLLDQEDDGKLVDTTVDPALEELEALPDSELQELAKAHKLPISESRTDQLLAFKAAGIRSASKLEPTLSLELPPPPAPPKKK